MNAFIFRGHKISYLPSRITLVIVENDPFRIVSDRSQICIVTIPKTHMNHAGAESKSFPLEIAPKPFPVDHQPLVTSKTTFHSPSHPRLNCPGQLHTTPATSVFSLFVDFPTIFEISLFLHLADSGFKPLPLTTRAILEVKPNPFIFSHFVMVSFPFFPFFFLFSYL